VKTLLLAICLLGSLLGDTTIRPDKQIVKLTDKLIQLEHELLIQKKADRFCKFYLDHGSFYSWNWSKERVLQYAKLIDKYKHLAGKQGSIDLFDFNMARIHSESDGRWSKRTVEPDKTISYGLFQLNDTYIWELEKQANKLYPNLKDKDVRTDAEKNIVCGMLWIKHKKEINQRWAILRPTAWDLFDELRKVS